MRRLPPLVREVARSLRRLGAASGGLVVAVSGGPDSVALLYALLDPARGTEDGRLVVAHLNHRLRGEESDADEDFVRALHARLTVGSPELRLRCASLDVKTAAAGENLESVARRLRYEWLAGVAQDEGVTRVVTGHTADDQAETVLHRLLRGAGLRGLRGIAPSRPLADGVVLLRPMLAVRRADVLAYLISLGEPYREDSSNLDPAFTRNRIRHELLPLLASRFNPEVVRGLCRLAGQAEETYAAEEAEALTLLKLAERPRAGDLLVFDRKTFVAAPRHRVREALRLAWRREGWPVGEMGFDAWERLAAVALGETAAVDLPGGVRARARGGVLRMGAGPRPDMV